MATVSTGINDMAGYVGHFTYANAILEALDCARRGDLKTAFETARSIRMTGTPTIEKSDLATRLDHAIDSIVSGS
jgi:hypothetical protein